MSTSSWTLCLAAVLLVACKRGGLERRAALEEALVTGRCRIVDSLWRAPRSSPAFDQLGALVERSLRVCDLMARRRFGAAFDLATRLADSIPPDSLRGQSLADLALARHRALDSLWASYEEPRRLAEAVCRGRRYPYPLPAVPPQVERIAAWWAADSGSRWSVLPRGFGGMASELEAERLAEVRLVLCEKPVAEREVQDCGGYGTGGFGLWSVSRVRHLWRFRLMDPRSRSLVAGTELWTGSPAPCPSRIRVQYRNGIPAYDNLLGPPDSIALYRWVRSYVTRLAE